MAPTVHCLTRRSTGPRKAAPAVVLTNGPRSKALASLGTDWHVVDTVARLALCCRHPSQTGYCRHPSQTGYSRHPSQTGGCCVVDTAATVVSTCRITYPGQSICQNIFCRTESSILPRLVSTYSYWFFVCCCCLHNFDPCLSLY